MSLDPLVKLIPIDKLRPGCFQPRRHFDEIELQELADAIKSTEGLLQPILVRQLAGQHYFEIIAGERRWRAAQLAGFETVSCLIKDFDDQQAMAAAIIENVSRVDLNPIEEAQAYQRLITEFHYTQEKVASAVGKSRTAITNSLRTLKLDQRVQQLLIAGLLTEGHSKVLMTLDHSLQYQLAEKSVELEWSVRKLEQEIKKQIPMPVTSKKDANIRALERALTDHIGCEVSINSTQQQGKLEINFHNLEALDGLFERLGFTYENS